MGHNALMSTFTFGKNVEANAYLSDIHNAESISTVWYLLFLPQLILHQRMYSDLEEEMTNSWLCVRAGL